MESFECPLCGEEHPQGARFCPVTGQTLEDPASAARPESDGQEQAAEVRQAIPVERPAFLREMSPVVLDLEGWLDDAALGQALEGLVSRNRDGQARQLLDVVTQEPDNATAWIWLAREARAGVEKRACLQKALQLEPEHAAARLAWAELDPLPAGRENLPAADDAADAPDREAESSEILTEPDENTAAVVQEAALTDGDEDLAVGADPQEADPQESYDTVELPDEALVQIVEGEDAAEPESRAGGARVFEPLLDVDLPEDDGAPEQESAPQGDWRQSTAREAAALRPRRRASRSELALIVVLGLLLLTNIWTALSIVRLERTVEALETQTADTHTLVTAFQEMVVDLLVRMDMMSPSGP